MCAVPEMYLVLTAEETMAWNFIIALSRYVLFAKTAITDAPVSIQCVDVDGPPPRPCLMSFDSQLQPFELPPPHRSCP